MELIDYFDFEAVVLERIQDSDIDESVTLINHAYKYQEQYKNEPRVNRETLITQVKKSKFYVAKSNNHVIATVYIQPKGETLKLGLLAVLDAYRGKGLAPAIIKAIEEYGRTGGFKSLALDYMSIAPWLKKYYEKYGFKETGEFENWGTIDLIHMEKSLC
ncbi:MAG TPA: GNAT family N-acetyltransferase [Patescibacteria group bacterium]